MYKVLVPAIKWVRWLVGWWCSDLSYQILAGGAALGLLPGVRDGRRNDDSGAGPVALSHLTGGHNPVNI